MHRSCGSTLVIQRRGCIPMLLVSSLLSPQVSALKPNGDRVTMNISFADMLADEQVRWSGRWSGDTGAEERGACMLRRRYARQPSTA